MSCPNTWEDQGFKVSFKVSFSYLRFCLTTVKEQKPH